MNKEEIIKRFKMIPHIEGGYFKETYRSAINYKSNQRLIIKVIKHYILQFFFYLEKTIFLISTFLKKMSFGITKVEMIVQFLNLMKI